MRKKISFFIVAMLAMISLNAQTLDDWVGDTDIDISQSSDAHTGTYSAKVTVNSGVQGSCDFDMANPISVTAGDSYTVSFFYKTSANVKGRLHMQWVGASATYEDYTDKDISTWTELTSSGTVPSGATGVTIGIRFYDQSGFVAGEQQFIDDVVFSSPTGTPIVVANGDMESWTGAASTDSLDWNNLQWPGDSTIAEGSNYNVYAQAYEPGVTDAVGQGAGVEVWIGVNNANTDPSTWTTWIPATYNTDAVHNDEYKAEIGSSLSAGTYYYASRFRLNGGNYTYGGFSATNGGFWDGTSNVSPVLTVTPATSNSIPYSRDFETGDINTDGWANKAVSNASYSWNLETLSGNTYTKMGNYNTTNHNYDDATAWYVSRAFDASSFTALLFNFKYAVYDLASGGLTVKVSTNYDGTSDPSTQGTWTDLAVNYTVDSYSTFTQVDDIDLSAYTGGDLYIAFVFSDESDAATGNTWKIDDINVFEPYNGPVISNIANNPTAPTPSDVVAVTADITDDVAVTSASLYWATSTITDTATATKVVMVPGTAPAYASSIPAQVDGTTIYYKIAASDGTDTTLSAEYSYTVAAPAPNNMLDAASIGTDAIAVIHNADITPNVADYILQPGNITFTVASYLDNNDHSFFGLAGPSPAIASDVILDTIIYTTLSDSIKFYAGQLPINLFNNANADTILNGYNTTFTGIVTATDAYNQFWVQDTAGSKHGIVVVSDNNTYADSVSVGDSVLVIAQRANYKGMTEFKDILHLDFWKGGTDTVPVSTVVPNAELDYSLAQDAPAAEQWEGQLVTLNGVTIDSLDGSHYEYFGHDINGIVLCIDDDANYHYTSGISMDIASTYNITGVVTYSFGHYKLNPRDTSDIEFVSAPAPTPTLAITVPTDGALFTTDTVDVTFDVTNFVLGTDGSVEYSIDGGATATTTTNTVQFTGLADGSHTVRLQLVDMSDVALSPAIKDSVSFTVAVTSPALEITSPADDATFSSDTVDVAFNAVNFVLGTDGSVEYSIDGGTTATTTTSPIQFTGLANGTHTVNLQLVDMSDVALSPAVKDSVSFTVTVIAISELANNVTIYPIPAGDIIYFAGDVANVELYSALGQKVNVELNNNSMNVTDLTSGVYVARITLTNGEIVTKQIIKK